MEGRALFGLDLTALTELMASFGQKPYRARQIFDALYKQRVRSVEEITTLSGELRERLLREGWAVGLPELAQTAVSVDGTERYLVRLADGETVETVWMPDGDGAAAEDEPEEIAAGVSAGLDLRGAAEEQQVPFGNDNKKGKNEQQAPSRSTALRANDNKGGKNEQQVPSRSAALRANDNKRGRNEQQVPSRSAALRANDNKGGKNNGIQQIPSLRYGMTSRKGEARAGQGEALRQRFGALAERGYRRATICVSSQVGCAVNCQFCLTAKLGIRRNLTVGEIAGQVAAVLNRHRIQIGQDRINLVFMGMGEPFLNYDEFMAAVRRLVEGIGIPESRMTVSTSGILPAMERFATETMRPKLALSLNASNDAVREEVMPITRKWKIAQLLEACRQIPLRTREWVTFEYVLLGGVNDQPEHAREVLALLDGMRAKVNLIVWNPGPGIAYTQPQPAAVERFQRLLIDGGIATYVRRPRGRDIYAACGQLKRTVAEESAPKLVEIVALGV